MNEKISLLSLVELASALSCGIAILFITYRILMIYAKRKLGMDKPNLSLMIFIAAVLMSMGLMISGVIQPILNYFRILSDSDISATSLIFKFITTGGAYILISYTISLIIIYLGVGLYAFMTPMDEIEEIKNNNIGVAIILTAILIILALMCKDAIILLIESLVPYPDLPPT